MIELHCCLVVRSFAVFVFYLPFLMNFIIFRSNKSTRKHDNVMQGSKFARVIRESSCFVHVSKWKLTIYFKIGILSRRVYFYYHCTSSVSSSYSYNNNLTVLIPAGNMNNASKTSLTYIILQNLLKESVFIRMLFRASF